LVGLDGCEVRLCDPCARVRPGAPFVSCVCVPAPPGVFERYVPDASDLGILKPILYKTRNRMAAATPKQVRKGRTGHPDCVAASGCTSWRRTVP
jgi:hypothetical protein